jgi:hypothetical protein
MNTLIIVVINLSMIITGWVMQMNCFLYIHRRWERDKVLLERALTYFRDIGHTCQVNIISEMGGKGRS